MQSIAIVEEKRGTGKRVFRREGKQERHISVKPWISVKFAFYSSGLTAKLTFNLRCSHPSKKSLRLVSLLSSLHCAWHCADIHRLKLITSSSKGVCINILTGSGKSRLSAHVFDLACSILNWGWFHKVLSVWLLYTKCSVFLCSFNSHVAPVCWGWLDVALSDWQAFLSLPQTGTGCSLEFRLLYSLALLQVKYLSF